MKRNTEDELVKICKPSGFTKVRDSLSTADGIAQISLFSLQIKTLPSQL
jgi:hypothetical protein